MKGNKIEGIINGFRKMRVGQSLEQSVKRNLQKFAKIRVIRVLQKYYDYLFKTHKKKTWTAIVILLIIYWRILPNPLFNDPTSYVLEAKNGDLLAARIATDEQWRFPETEVVPEKFAKAIVTFEDKRFWVHPGVDPIGIGRAIIQNIREGSVVSGGSTLTMQVIRLSRKGKSRSLWEKGIEAILATRLEVGYRKSSILKLYASHAPFGGNVVGIDAASWRYYGKSPELLSWSEAATLAVLPNAPALIHPGRNRAALEAKRNRLLDKLLANGDLDSTTCQLAKTEPIPEDPLPLPKLAPHLLDRAFANYFNQKTINNSAFRQTRLQTTIDKNIQKRVNQIVQGHYETLSGNGIHNISALVLNVETGETVAYVGNVNYYKRNENHGQSVDVITAPRSTGSILKPFLYAMMLDEGTITPTALVPDIPTQLHNYRPENYHQTYDGVIPAKRAISRSLNVPLIRMLQMYGLEKFHFNLQRLGMTTIQKEATHYGLPLILGGAEGNIWELTSIYASMGRTLNHVYSQNGLYNPHDFRMAHYLADTKIPEPKEKDFTEAPTRLSAASIYAAFEAMLEVERPNEDGSWDLFQSKKRVAWKTGTSFGFRDAWAIGVTPQYAVGIWVGNADGEGRPNLVGVKAAAPILFDIFDILKTPTWFDPPYDEMIEMPICAESGYREKDICEHIDTVWMPLSCQRSEVCPYHRVIHLDDNGKQVHGDCVTPSQMIHQPWFVLPPVEEFYYKTNNPSYQVLPNFRSDCQASIANQNPMRMIYPNQRNMKIFVPIELDGTLGKTIFSVAHRKPNTLIYWHLDNEYLGSTETFHEFALRPEPGKHRLTLVDESGNSVGVDFEILGGE
jgi:penicillin-binding protein 1C